MGYLLATCPQLLLVWLRTVRNTDSPCTNKSCPALFFSSFGCSCACSCFTLPCLLACTCTYSSPPSLSVPPSPSLPLPLPPAPPILQRRGRPTAVWPSLASPSSSLDCPPYRTARLSSRTTRPPTVPPCRVCAGQSPSLPEAAEFVHIPLL